MDSSSENDSQDTGPHVRFKTRNVDDIGADGGSQAAEISAHASRDGSVEPEIRSISGHSESSQSEAGEQIDSALSECVSAYEELQASVTKLENPPLCPSAAVNSSTEDLNEKLYPGCRITRAESLLLIMGHRLRHHATKEATESLLKVIEAHLPQDNDFPLSKYIFKGFSGSSCTTSLQLYCPSCGSYMGNASCTNSDCCCPHCEMSHSTDVLMRSGSYFVMLDIQQQLRHLLQQPNFSFRFAGRTMTHDVSDITESKAYHQLPMRGTDISLTWNTDGAPVFESSKFSIWPLQLMVNELPQEQRNENVLLGGLWFGSSKPQMNCFLHPFVEEMNRLSSDGMMLEDTNGVEHWSHVFPAACCVDTVARYSIMNTTQLNGAFGCAWCEHEGFVVEKGRESAHVYP